MLKNTPPKHSTKNIKPPFEERVYAEKKKSLPVLLNMIDSPII